MRGKGLRSAQAVTGGGALSGTYEALSVGNWKPSSKALSMKLHWLEVAALRTAWEAALANRL